MKEPLLVISPRSLTGARFTELAVGDGVELYGAGRSDVDAESLGLKDYFKLDITDKDSCLRVLDRFPGRYFINFAGETAVDEIEKTRPGDLGNKKELEGTLAYQVNVEGVENLLEGAKKLGKKPVFISTGWVFDGSNGPNSEADLICRDLGRVSYYAGTKILAEEAIARSGVDSMLVRIDFPIGRRYELKGDLAQGFLRMYDRVCSGEMEKMHPIFADQIITPTYLDDVYSGIAFLIEGGQSGIFHIASPERVSMWGFVCELLRVARGLEGAEEYLQKGSLREYMEKNPSYAKRPVNGGIRVDKISDLGYRPLDYKQAIWQTWGKARNG